MHCSISWLSWFSSRLSSAFMKQRFSYLYLHSKAQIFIWKRLQGNQGGMVSTYPFGLFQQESRKSEPNWWEWAFLSQMQSYSKKEGTCKGSNFHLKISFCFLFISATLAHVGVKIGLVWEACRVSRFGLITDSPSQQDSFLHRFWMWLLYTKPAESTQPRVFYSEVFSS